MRTSIDRTKLVKALEHCSGVADAKGVMPSLALVRLSSGDRLHVGATDLVTWIGFDLEASGDDAGALCVDARTLHRVTGAMSGERVDLAVKDGRLSVRGGSAEYKLPYTTDREYPKAPEPVGATFTEVDTDRLCSMLDKTTFSVARDDSRIHLCGVFFDGDGTQAALVSTDGHRMSRANGLDFTGKASWIIPSKAARRLQSALTGETCKIGYVNEHLFVVSGDMTISVKPIQAEFPPYRGVIPKHPNGASVPASELLAAVKRAGVIADDGAGAVVIEFFEDLLKLTGESQMGEARETVACEYGGQPVRIGVSARYLVDVLSNAGAERVRLEVGGELAPIVVRPIGGGNDEFVIMPMRV